jgi:hypothetical protein
MGDWIRIAGIVVVGLLSGVFFGAVAAARRGPQGS